MQRHVRAGSAVQVRDALGALRLPPCCRTASARGSPAVRATGATVGRLPAATWSSARVVPAGALAAGTDALMSPAATSAGRCRGPGLAARPPPPPLRAARRRRSRRRTASRRHPRDAAVSDGDAGSLEVDARPLVAEGRQHVARCPPRRRSGPLGPAPGCTCTRPPPGCRRPRRRRSRPPRRCGPPCPWRTTSRRRWTGWRRQASPSTCCAMTQFSPEMTCDQTPVPVHGMARTGTMLAAGATPRVAPAAAPATAVPWPCRSPPCSCRRPRRSPASSGLRTRVRGPHAAVQDVDVDALARRRRVVAAVQRQRRLVEPVEVPRRGREADRAVGLDRLDPRVVGELLRQPRRQVERSAGERVLPDRPDAGALGAVLAGDGSCVDAVLRRRRRPCRTRRPATWPAGRPGPPGRPRR